MAETWDAGISYRGNWNDVNAGKESYRSMVMQVTRLRKRKKTEV
jgi:hypothetical protein